MAVMLQSIFRDHNDSYVLCHFMTRDYEVTAKKIATQRNRAHVTPHLIG